jgi:transcription antitermination protein NusB
MNETGKIRVIPLAKDEEIAQESKKIAKKSSKAAVDTDVATAALVKTFKALNKEDYQLLASSPRRRAREAAFMLVYQIDQGSEDINMAAAFLEDIALNESGQAFAMQLAQNALKDQDNSDNLINAYTKEWTVERLASIDRSILHLAISELLRDQDDSSSIIINEAIELAKKFGDENSRSFINGILDAIRIKEIPDTANKDPLK